MEKPMGPVEFVLLIIMVVLQLAFGIVIALFGVLVAAFLLVLDLLGLLSPRR